jgi:hypothetical protein
MIGVHLGYDEFEKCEYGNLINLDLLKWFDRVFVERSLMENRKSIC